MQENSTIKMASPIFFNVPQARDFLLQHGYVYTLRRKRQEGRTEAREGSYYRFTALGRVAVVHVQDITSWEELQPYVHASGFNSIDEWISHAPLKASHLYLVVLLDKNNNSDVLD